MKGRRRGKRSAVYLACATTLLGLAPATVSAQPGFEVLERGLRLQLSAHGSNDYSIVVVTAGHRRVTLSARKAGVAATYTTTGRVTRQGISATFGELGRISVRFRGERRPFPGLLPPGLEAFLPDLDLPRRRCHGRKPVREVGSFHGVIRFEGEDGFTRIDEPRARGEVERFYTRVCERWPGSAGKPVGGDPGGEGPDGLPDLKVSLLYAADRSPGRKVAFETLGLELGRPPKGFGLFVAGGTVVEHEDRMLIVRQAVKVGDQGSVILSPPGTSPTTATIALPGPLFSGTADYRKEPGSAASWTGSLSVRPPAPASCD